MHNAKQIARNCRVAVFKQVEDDRALNAENIERAIHKELAVVDDSADQSLLMAEIVMKSRDLVSGISKYKRPDDITQKCDKLDALLRQIGA
jgi:hypothetical protein